jgi:hypothetical protein
MVYSQMIGVHFGLDKAAKIDGPEIRWPSRKVGTIKDLEADKFDRGIEPAEKNATYR